MIKHCAVYLHRSKDVALAVACLQDTSGILYEDVMVQKSTISDFSSLGMMARAAFNRSERRPKIGGFRDAKLTEWPAFKASEMGSVSSFKSSFVRYAVSGQNSANVTVSITSQEVTSGVSLTASCSPAVELHLGDTVGRLHKYYLRWQAA